jgi:hypothetical protein
LDNSEHYPVEVVVGLLDELKASGDYDRIIAEETVTGLDSQAG